MTDQVETLLYANVAQDLKARFGWRAYDIATEARESLAQLGDVDGEDIWARITSALGQMDGGQMSSAVH